MVDHTGAFGLLVGVAGGTVFLVPAHGSAQDSLSVSWEVVGVVSPPEDLLRCAERGMADAQHNLGLMYDFGYGVPRDDVEAVRWLRLASLLSLVWWDYRSTGEHRSRG
jgi:hypothetical protein